MKRILVTGGAGFIGSHLVDALMPRGLEVCVFDNLSAGNMGNLERWQNDSRLTFVKGDLLNPADLAKLRENYDTIFHLAANPEVRVGATNPTVHFQQNVVATHNLLEHIKERKKPSTLILASTSTVYGDAAAIPTSEDYAPLKPISTYGASKLACEALVSAYAYTFNFNAIIYRLANIIGPRSQHGVIHDFVQKLKSNPKELEILGDGRQTKSYLHVDDCIQALVLGLEKTKEQVEIYNIGSEDQVDVKTIAHAVTEEMKLKNTKFTFTGGVDGGRGWKGDVKIMLLSIAKLKRLGWRPSLGSEQSVKRVVHELLKSKSAQDQHETNRQ